jgi:hypothetical protein
LPAATTTPGPHPLACCAASRPGTQQRRCRRPGYRPAQPARHETGPPDRQGQMGDGDLVPPVRDRLPEADAAPPPLRLRHRRGRGKAPRWISRPPRPRLSRIYGWMLDHSHGSPQSSGPASRAATAVTCRRPDRCLAPQCRSPLTLGPAQRPAEPSMTSRSRSACPLCRAYSSTRCCHIQRTEMVVSRKVNVSSSLAPSSAASTARRSAR